MREHFVPVVSLLLLCAGSLLGIGSVSRAHAQSAPGDTLYVDKGASGADDGSSWADAYTSLPDALAAARTNGTDDAVWVAAGTYYPDEGASAVADDRTASFRVEDGIDLRGHFSGDEEKLSDRTLARDAPKTVLSGEIQQDGDATNNAYTVLRMTGGAAGELHIEAGAANGSGPHGRGGGAHVSGGTLHHAVLTDNRAGRGAALLVTGNPTLEVLRVTGNRATGDAPTGGGSIYFNGDASTVEHLTVADNTADHGPTGLYFIDSDATLNDLGAGPNTTNDVRQTVTATINGSTLQEGQPLPNADLTFTNADADTTVGTTTSDSNGDYSFATSYPEDQSYTLSVGANTEDHAATTTSISLDDTDTTYTADLDLERLIYDLTVNTDDANTTNAVNANGAVTNNGTNLADYTTGNDGQATVQINTSASQVSNEADTTNYDSSSETVSLGGSKSVSSTLNLLPIQYTFDGTVTDQDGTAVNDATVSFDDTDGNQITTTTNTSGEYTITGSINNGDLEENEYLTTTADKDGYNSSSKNTTADPDNRTKTLDITIEKQSTVDRIPVTFTTKTVGDTLYTNGYGETLTYQVSTDDTTFTATGGESADIPIRDGDNLEISSSDSAYLSTLAANNTDGEPKPFNVSGFPDEPDYQNTTISIPKASITNQKQIVGFPDTSPDGRDVGNIYVPFVNEATRYTERQAGDETLDKVPIWIFDENDSFVNKAQNAVDAVRDVLPYPTEGPYVISGTNALVDSAEARNEFNYHYVEGGSNTNTQFYNNGYIKSSNNSFSGSTNQGTRISETYSGLVDMDNQGGTEINVYVFDDDGTFDKNEAALPVVMEYHSLAGSSLQP
jgi:hypothetical protein